MRLARSVRQRTHRAVHRNDVTAAGTLIRSGADVNAVIAESELLVVGLATPVVIEALARGATADKIVLDLAPLPDRSAIAAQVEGLCW